MEKLALRGMVDRLSDLPRTNTITCQGHGKMTACPICQNDHLVLLYTGPIRSGPPDSELTSGYEVLECRSCDLGMLSPIPEGLSDTYDVGSYWAARSSTEPEFKKKHLREQMLWLTAIGLHQFVDQRVIELGCGHGFFLDLIRYIARSTCGIELDRNLARCMAARGHTVGSDTRDAEDHSFDVLVSFDALEHIESPGRFAREAHRILTKNGRLYVGVPNKHDFLKKIVPEYKPFFYHKTHIYYYSAKSLSFLFSQNGFVTETVQSIHKYDIMNMVTWASKGAGSGVQGSTLFDFHTESNFRTNLERQGIGSHILFCGRKL